MVPTISGPDEFSSALRWWLDHPGERERVATAARTAIEGRTFTTHARWLLEQLGH